MATRSKIKIFSFIEKAVCQNGICTLIDCLEKKLMQTKQLQKLYRCQLMI